MRRFVLIPDTSRLYVKLRFHTLNYDQDIGKNETEESFFAYAPVQRFVISVIVAVIIYLLLLETYAGSDDKNNDRMVGLCIILYHYKLCCFFYTKFSGHPKTLQAGRWQPYLCISSCRDHFVCQFIYCTVINVIQNATETPQKIFIPVAVSCMLFSWLMVHTIFAFHYAHLYYRDDTDDSSKHAEGLEFPGEKKPDYIDFVYFSFVVGMTFQVSDTAVTSRSIRRLVILHGLLSFGLNTFVVALTINLIAGLMK